MKLECPPFSYFIYEPETDSTNWFIRGVEIFDSAMFQLEILIKPLPICGNHFNTWSHDSYRTWIAIYLDVYKYILSYEGAMKRCRYKMYIGT